MNRTSIKGHSVFTDELYDFYPDDPVAGMVKKSRCTGTGIRQSDGTFTFIRKKSERSGSKCIFKLPHGRLSSTVDNCFQLTIKLPKDDESISDFSQSLFAESMKACNALRLYLQKD